MHQSIHFINENGILFSKNYPEVYTNIHEYQDKFYNKMSM